ncbi:MAG: LemA family protein [Clostridium sp.]|nr:LemA family protein [Clostridium sp.]MCM1444543.1 LemA family protein [Candidatus Amulumruptor caecigallinarius]
MEVFLFIVLVVSVILLWGAFAYNKFQEFIIRSNAVEADIDSVLRKRYDLLNKSISIIKNNTEETEVLEGIPNLKSKKLSNFDLDRHLYNCINEFNEYKIKYDNLKEDDEFNKIDSSLKESEIEISALRKYYNKIITDYNKYVKSFPSILVAFIFRYKKKPYYDGKNMDDEIINDFRL